MNLSRRGFIFGGLGALTVRPEAVLAAVKPAAPAPVVFKQVYTVFHGIADIRAARVVYGAADAYSDDFGLVRGSDE